MAKYDSTIFGEARSETADRRSGRTERIIRNESSADFLSAVSQPVRQMFYLQSGNCLGSRDRPSGTPSSPANGRAGFVPFGLGPKSGIIGSFPAARMLCRFARTPIRATATDRSPSDSAGCSRLPFSVRTTGHELIRSSDEPSDFAVGNIPVETDVDPMPFVHMVAGLYALVAVPQIDRLVRVALQTAEIELADMDETEPFVPHAEHEQFPVVLRGRFVERHLVACAREREAVCPEFFYVHFGSSESACRSAFLMRGPSCRSLRTNFFGAGNASGNLPKRTGPRGSRDQDTLPFSVRTWRSPGGWLRPRPGSRSCRLRRSTGRYGTRTIRRAGCRDRARNTRS